MDARILVRNTLVLAVVLLSISMTPAIVAGAGRPAVCFAPDTPEATIEDFYRFYYPENNPELSLFQFEDVDRWTTTATNGGGLSQGDPTTITWSIVPDGTALPFGPAGADEPQANSTLIARLDLIYGDDPNADLTTRSWFPLFVQVFDRWAQLSGNTYVYEANDSGNPVSGAYPGVLGVRGDVRIGGHLIDGNSGILAYNYFPNHGDMVIDTADNFYEDLTGNSLGLRNVLAHEHGHGLGFQHVCPVNQTKLMEPFVSDMFDGPQHDDTLAVNRGYGDRFEDNNTSGTATSLGSPGFAMVAIDDVSIDDNSDVDWYSLTVAGLTQLDVALNPIGFTYLNGVQEPNGCTPGTSFNSLIINNLGVEVRAPNGTTVMASANSNPAGQSESIAALQLASAGTYFVRVFGGGVNNVQLYNLDLILSNGDPNAPPANDSCENAICVAEGVGVNGSTANATGSGIAGCDVADPNDVWYSYTPQVDEPNVVVSLCGSTFDTTLAVLESCNDLLLIACNDDFCGTQSQLSVSMIGGVTYLIRVAGAGGAEGDFTLTVNGGMGDCQVVPCDPPPITPMNPDPGDAATGQSIYTSELIWNASGGSSTSVGTPGGGQANSSLNAGSFLVEPDVRAFHSNGDSLPGDTVQAIDTSMLQNEISTCLDLTGGPIAFFGNNKLRGNVLTMSTDEVLSEIAFDLSYNGFINFTFVVYEANSPNGQYTKIYEATMLFNGSGRSLYTTGTINVNLVSGNSYFIGVGWEPENVFYFSLSDSFPQAFSSGTVEGGNGADNEQAPYFSPVLFPLVDTGRIYNAVYCFELLCPQTFDVYFGADNPPATLACSGVTSDPNNQSPPWNCDLSTVLTEPLQPCTDYYWRVVSKNTCCPQIAGPIWSFTTGIPADLNASTKVDLVDFSLLAPPFNLGGACSDPDWCGGADINRNGSVGIDDVSLMGFYWLNECIEP
jgi:hypothetical protein